MAQQARRKYVLESKEESERLDRQSRMKAHDFKPELQFLKVTNGLKILDAGCGSGIVSDYLSRLASEVQVTGWDFSNDRIEMAKEKYGSTQIEFSQKDLLKVDEGPQFDAIVCRYVLHHFGEGNARQVIQNLLNVLKPGGMLCCINPDGLMGDVYPSSTFLREGLAKLRSSDQMDFQLAKKTPSIFVEYGLQNVDWHALVSEFKDDELIQETENLMQSLQNARPFVEDRLGGAVNADRFQKEYLQTLQSPGCALFYNKVVVTGTKPRNRPQLVKG